jgi:hypothetical protein
MPSAGFESAIPAVEPPQTYNLDHTATEICDDSCYQGKILDIEVTCNVKIFALFLTAKVKIL